MGDAPYRRAGGLPQHKVNAAVLDRASHPPEGLRPQCEGVVPVPLMEVLRDCWCYDVECRPSFPKIAETVETVLADLRASGADHEGKGGLDLQRSKSAVALSRSRSF